jgi:hypothetical protein
MPADVAESLILKLHHQIKFLLGRVSIQTTERYLGSEQEIAVAVNDNLGL